MISNLGGRVTTLNGEVVPGEYTSDWVRRGGVIGTNKTDAEGTVRHLLEDAVGSIPAEAPADTALLLKRKGCVRYMTKDWQRVANAERRGGRKNRRGLKFSSVEAMLGVLEPPSSL